MERVAIAGSGGSGKSTLARQLGDITGLPVIHLDREHWRPGWVEPPREEWERRVAELSAGERWIIDGNYGGTMGERFARADTIVFLDIGRLTCLYRVAKRRLTYRGQSRPDMADGCCEQLDPAFMKWVWDYRTKQRPTVMRLLAEARKQGKRVVILRNGRQVRAFLRDSAGPCENRRRGAFAGRKGTRYPNRPPDV